MSLSFRACFERVRTRLVDGALRTVPMCVTFRPPYLRKVMAKKGLLRRALPLLCRTFRRD